MRLISALLLLMSIAAHANPAMTVKERLRLHMWHHGLEDKSIKQKAPQQQLPEEIERALRKL